MSAMEPPWRHHLVRFPSSLRAQLALQESVLTSCRWCVAAASCGGPLKRATDRSDGHFHALFLTKTVDFLPKTWRRHPFFLFPKVLAPKKSSHEDFEPRNVFFFTTQKWGTWPILFLGSFKDQLGGSEFIARSLQSCMAHAEQALGDGSWRSSRSGVHGDSMGF